MAIFAGYYNSRLSVAFAIGLLLWAGCAKHGEPKKMTKTILLVQVKSVDPFISEHKRTLKQWKVGFEVIDIISSPSEELKTGDSVGILVHSVIRTFLVDVKNLPDKRFEIEYNEPFERLYQGDVKVREITSSSDSKPSSDAK